MLRLMLLALMLTNVVYFGWAHGKFAAYGFAPVSQSEPQRMLQQIKPEAMRLVAPAGPATSKDPAAAVDGAAAPGAPDSAAATAAVSTTTSQAADTPPATQCLQAGLYTEAQTAALRTSLQTALPSGGWTIESSVEPARWMVYMGKYADVEALNKKRGELRQRRVSFEPLNNAALEPGLSLGTFLTQDEAVSELARIATHGVKTARVIQSRPEIRGQRLKLAAVDAQLRAQLDGLKPQLLGKTLENCR